MKIKQLKLQNYGRFEDLTIDFAPTEKSGSSVTVIVGNNGAGKSQILQALVISLSWFVALLKSDSYKGFDVPEQSIKNNQNNVLLKTTVDFNNFDIPNPSGINKTPWVVAKTREGRINDSDNGIYLMELRRVAYKYREALTNDDNLSLPLVVFYAVERAVLQHVKADVLSHGYDQMEGYSNTLDSNGIDFSEFLSWFRNAEDIENELNKSVYVKYDLMSELEDKSKQLEKQTIKLKKIIDFEPDSEKKAKLYAHLINNINKSISLIDIYQKEIDETINIHNESITLVAIREAIERFTDFKNPRIRRQGIPTMIVEKDGEELDINQLSQGEKSLLALVGDIARRLTILNPSLDNPLEGEGVVMIDEVDLHLHPKWQHDLIDKLVRTFPNVQFILTTHSPHVISDRSDILVYSLDDGEIEQIPNVYGQDVNTVLTKVFDVDIRDSEVEIKFNNIRRAISHKKYLSAEKGIQELSEKMPADDVELLKCRLMLAQAKVNDKKDNELEHADD